MITTLNQLAALASGRCGRGRQLQQLVFAFRRAFGDSMHTARAVWCGPVRRTHTDVPNAKGGRGKPQVAPAASADPPASGPAVRRSLYAAGRMQNERKFRVRQRPLPPVGSRARQRPNYLRLTGHSATVTGHRLPRSASNQARSVTMGAGGLTSPLRPTLSPRVGRRGADVGRRGNGRPGDRTNPALSRKWVQQVPSAGGSRGSHACRAGGCQQCR
jgi:hypothetical protein